MANRTTSSRIDLTGKVFGKLKVISFSGTNHRLNAMWLCACECGSEKVVIGSHLTSGNSASCGCVRLSNMVSKTVDITGKRFGRLVVTSRGVNLGRGRIYWNCRCDCGNTISTVARSLKIGRTKTCGCSRTETSAQVLHKIYEHLEQTLLDEVQA